MLYVLKKWKAQRKGWMFIFFVYIICGYIYFTNNDRRLPLFLVLITVDLFVFFLPLYSQNYAFLQLFASIHTYLERKKNNKMWVHFIYWPVLWSTRIKILWKQRSAKMKRKTHRKIQIEWIFFSIFFCKSGKFVIDFWLILFLYFSTVKQGKK